MFLDERNTLENCDYELVAVARNSDTAAYTTTAPHIADPSPDAYQSFVLVRAPYFPLPATFFPFNKERILLHK